MSSAPVMMRTRCERMLPPGLRCGTLFFTSAAQDAFHTVVPLVTGVLEHLLARVDERNGQGPRLCKRRRVGDRHPIVDLARADPREALDEMKVLGRSAVKHLVGEVRRVDDQRL